MSQDTPIKKYPLTTAEVAKMLGIQGNVQDLPMGTFVSRSDLPVADLPVVLDNPRAHEQAELKKTAPVGPDAASLHGASHPLSEAAVKPTSPAFIKIAKAGAPYAAVFAAGLLIYYFFFTGINFGDIFKTAPKAATPKQSAAQLLENQNLPSFNKWMLGFYYDVTDPKILDPEADNSGNGLSNFQKYLLNLNPKAYDSLGIGKADSEVIASGIDPATGMPLSDGQKALVSKYIDMEVVMNRLALNRLQRPQEVAGAQVNTSGGFFNNLLVPTASANGIRGPQSQDQNNQNFAFSPNTGAQVNSSLMGNINIDTNVPGRLEIPDLKINVPIIWSKDTNSFDKDLQIGVVHYPGTALPGQIGTAYISGHSSNYAWVKGNFNRIFTHLGDLADNTSFKITVVQQNGKDAILHYVVTHRKVYTAADQEQFANSGKSIVALSTCWPVNTTAKRLVVFGELTQVEK